HTLNTRERMARAKRAPTDRFFTSKGQNTMDAVAFHEALQAAAVLRAFDLLPEFAAAGYAPPHAPATAARSVVAKEPDDVGPIGRRQWLDGQGRWLVRCLSFHNRWLRN